MAIALIYELRSHSWSTEYIDPTYQNITYRVVQKLVDNHDKS